MKVYGPGGRPKWHVGRDWSAARGRPRLGRMWLSPVGLAAMLVELAMVIANLYGRFCRNDPWPVEARSGEFAQRWLIVGWYESGEAVEFIARTIRASGKPPAYVPGDRTPYS